MIAKLNARQKLRNRTTVKVRAADIQESLKILQFRFGRKVGFRPVAVRRGVRYYPVEGKLRTESEIVSWTAACKS
jgi:hypothetical protein